MLCYMFSSAFNCRHILFHISSCKKENENSSYSANDSDSQKHTVRGGFFQNLPSNERGNSGSQSEAHIKKGLSLDSISGRQNYSYLLAEGIITVIVISIPAVAKALTQVKRAALQ